MPNQDNVNKALEIIKTHGDIFDVVSTAKNVKSTEKGMARFNLLFFSRILYGAFLIGESIKNKFAPVKEVYEAQETIRDACGVRVDVVRLKFVEKLRDCVWHNDKQIYLLYENNSAFLDEYISSAKKILTFISLYDITGVFISVEDLSERFPNINLSSFNAISRSTMLNKVNKYISDEEPDAEDFIVLNASSLSYLISILESYKVDYKFIMKIGRKIDDPGIKVALDEYRMSFNLEKLKDMIASRLCLSINSDSSYKTKKQGKAYDTISLHDEYVKVITNYAYINKTENTVMLLCDYLGYPSYEAMLLSINKNNDDLDKTLMAILYLYLSKQKRVDIISPKSHPTYYDRIYHSFIHNPKKTFGINYKIEKQVHNAISCLLTIYFTFVICAAGLVGTYLIDLLNTYAFGGEKNAFLKSVVEYITLPYKYAWGIEKNLCDSLLENVNDAKEELSSSISSVLDESLFDISASDKDKVIGNVYPLEDTLYIDLPNYYAAEYGSSSTYSKGEIDYELEEMSVSFDDMLPFTPEFKVEVYFSKKDLKNMIDNNMITIPMALYPMGDNYVITKIEIIDAKDEEKNFTISAQRGIAQNGYITQEEKDLLLSMKKPHIIYYYAINYEYDEVLVQSDESTENAIVYYLYYEPICTNPFAANMVKEDYLSTPSSQMRSIIASSLSLPEDASCEEIYWAIKSKKYSTSPYKDSGYKGNIRKLDEKEFIETIASMDYLICNLAATLAVEVDDNLFYTVGFYTNETTITMGDAHAWAMDNEGNITDVTPYLKDEEEKTKSIIDDVIIWAAKNQVPLYLAIGAISLLVGNSLKKKITITIKIHNAKKLLQEVGLDKAYCLINETLYGGNNLPKDRSPIDYLKILNADFKGFSKEDLQSLLQELKNNSSKDTKMAIKVIKNVPFIRSNAEDIALSLRKKKKK